MPQKSFDLIHYDIWRPFSVSSYNGYKYFIIIVDDCTRFTFLKNKSDATAAIPLFFKMVTKQFNSHIKTLRSDNARELLITNFLDENEVLHQFSCVQSL